MQLVQTLIDNFGEEGFESERSNLRFIRGAEVYPITRILDRKVVYLYNVGTDRESVSDLRPEYNTDLIVSKVLIRRTIVLGRLITFVLTD